jgi:DNA polymerase I-like protein with 3'-5' exonuclease and polymerase domains
MCQPPKGFAIGGIDYSSQEFLLSAVCSRDPKMIQAYKDGDVYLYYGKGIGLIPPEGTKQTHKAERDLCKSTVLGLSYLMTKVGLAKKLTADTGKIVTEDEAEKLVNSFDSLFSIFSSWRKSVIQNYEIAKYLRLPDGWHMFGDNPSHRSAANMPLQGAGACIMRLAVMLAQDAGLNIIFTLHDAIYLMCPINSMEESMDLLASCMKKAFVHYFHDDQKEAASIIRVDAKVWGPDLDEYEIITKNGLKLDCSKIHIDERAEKEYDMFKKFFYEDPNLELL